MKHLVVPVMDHVSLLISVWLLILVKMVAHVLLPLMMVAVIYVSVPCPTLESTVKVRDCLQGRYLAFCWLDLHL